MRKLGRLAAAAAGSGLLALGGVIASAGVASAGTHVSGCTAYGSLVAGAIPNCASTGMVKNPTAIRLTVGSPELSVLTSPARSIAGQGLRDEWTLKCYAGSVRLFTRTGTLDVTAPRAATSMTLPLGRHVPGSCTVASAVQTMLPVNATLLANVRTLDVRDVVTADTAVPRRHLDRHAERRHVRQHQARHRHPGNPGRDRDLPARPRGGHWFSRPPARAFTTVTDQRTRPGPAGNPHPGGEPDPVRR